MAARVLIAAHDLELRNHIRENIGKSSDIDIIGLARDGEEALQMALRSRPDVALISDDLPGIPGIKTCEMISALVPDVMPVLICGKQDAGQMAGAMQLGIRAIISKTASAEALTDLIEDLAEIKGRRTSKETQEWKDPARFPRIVSVTGAKGGVGKSTIAVNLAVTLAKSLPRKVALFDLYTQFGDVSTMLNVVPKRTIADMFSASPELDTEMVKDYVTHHPSGVDVFVTSVDPSPLDAVGVEFMDNLLHTLKSSYRYVVIDMPHMLQDLTFSTLSSSDEILLIANLLDVTTIADTKKLYDTLLREHFVQENIKIVLNRESRANRLSLRDVERMFSGCQLYHLSNDNNMGNAVNQGTPITLAAPNSPFAHDMALLAEAVMGLDNVADDKTVSVIHKLFKAA
jgi:pilus assembly protein CpaE